MFRIDAIEVMVQLLVDLENRIKRNNMYYLIINQNVREKIIEKKILDSV